MGCVLLCACSSPEQVADALFDDTLERCPGPDADAEEEPIAEHNVFMAVSADGAEFLSQAEPILTSASVPEISEGPGADEWVYHVNGIPGQHGTWVARQLPDASWTSTCVTIDGEYPLDLLDPDVVQLDDGTYVLFYLDGGASKYDPQSFFMRATSDNGVDFTDPVPVFSGPELTDPSVVLLDDGTWHMSLSRGQRTLLTASDDGMQFLARGHVLEFGGVGELHMGRDGLRLYVQNDEGIISATSSDGGEEWTQDDQIHVARAQSPSVVERDGWFHMAYVLVGEAEEW